jgi:uncharacterized SAM-binding protein YcdF (DUF218 family)
LTQALLLGLVTLVAIPLRRLRAAFCALALATGWLYLCSTAVFADYLMGVLEDDYPQQALPLVAQADAIVLLGGAIRGDVPLGGLGDLNQQADRLVYAVALYKAGRAPRLLVTGGAEEGARSEAEIMRELLEVMGVPSNAILLEDRSRNTYQNAVFTARMLKTLGIRRILLVTSAFHMRRSEALFRAQGIDVIPAPTDFQRLAAPVDYSHWLPSVGDLWQSTYALHELLGYQVYRLRGWL